MTDEGKFTRALKKSQKEKGQSAQSQTQREAWAPAASSATHEASKTPFHRIDAGAAQPDGAVVMVHDKWGEAAAQVRAIRARILEAGKGKPPRVIAVSSGTREEGKTTVAFNLAVALCEVDPGRVVIVDGDRRGPAIHRLANLKPDRGLHHILEDDLKLDGNVYETSIARLDMISSFPVSQLDGHEDLLEQRCESFLTELRRHYSFVVIDTPPVMSSTEARTFGKYSDGAVLVARLEKTPRYVVKRAKDELTSSGTNIIGCVLTHRKDHVPNFLYSFVGHPSQYYYYNYRRKKDKGAKAKNAGKKK